MEWQIQASINKELREGNIINANQCELMENKSCQTKLDIFFDEITGLGDKGNSVNIIYLDICKTFDLEAQSILGKLNNTKSMLPKFGGLARRSDFPEFVIFLPKKALNNYQGRL